MTSPNEHSQGRNPPTLRKVPHSLTTSFFKSSRRPTESRTSPVAQSPTITIRSPASPLFEVSAGHEPSEARQGALPTPEPIAIPEEQNAPHKQKKLAPNTFNTHYRSISRSMNDLGNIFSRGRSPPNREGSPRRTTTEPVAPPSNDSKRRRQPEGQMSSKQHESSGVPAISVAQHSEQSAKGRIIKEGWVNVIDSGTVKKGPLKDAWRLQHAILSDTFLVLYKPPSGLQIRAFDVEGDPPATPRPQSAPATASPAFSVSSVVHKAPTRHPELQVGADGIVQGGSMEAICHELMFTKDGVFVDRVVRSLPAWAAPEGALSVLMEISTVGGLSTRLAEIINILATSSPGLLLEGGTYNSARLLVEKAITPHNPKLAQECRTLLEDTRASLQAALDSSTRPQGPLSPSQDSFTITTRNLYAEEFLQMKPDVLAQQIHLFHLRYLRGWSPVNDISVLLASPHFPPPSHRNPLVFSSAGMHFLSERVLSHVLCGDSSKSLERRVRLLSHWLRVAQSLRASGDAVGYLAITMAVLSPPVLRLRDTWSHIDLELYQETCAFGGKAMRLLERRRLDMKCEKSDDARVFVPQDFGVGCHSQEGVPYFGDLLHCLDDAHANPGRTVDIRKVISGLYAVMNSVKKWEKQLVDTDTRKTVGQRKQIEHIQQCLETLNVNNQNPSSANSTMFFNESLKCEPTSTGLYLSSHYHQRLPLTTGSNIPLLFTDVRASFALFDKHDTLAFSGALHKKAPSSGLASPSTTSYPSNTDISQNQNLKPPVQPTPQTLRRTHSFPPAAPQGNGYDGLESTTRERTAVLQGGDSAMMRAIRDVAGVGQQLFYSKDGELVLKAVTEESQSRPVSVIESTSNRQSISSTRYSDAMGSLPYGESGQDRGGLSTGSKGGTASSMDVKVVPKGGTLERLVDILVLGVEDFSTRMNRSSDYDHDKVLNLKMNMDVFTITFFATFRSYCSPAVLIDYLKKRLLGSKSAATFSRDEGDDVVFPDWTGIDHVEDSEIDWALVAKIHFGILHAVYVWISEFFMDFHSDQYLGESFMSFLDVAAQEVAIWTTASYDKGLLKTRVDGINLLWQDIRTKFAALVFMPATHETRANSRTELHVPLPSCEDTQAVTRFMSELDSYASFFLSKIQLVDWMLAFELLENQSADPLGFFVPKASLLRAEEDEPIQNIFSTLSELRCRSNESSVLESFPKSVRDACTFHVRLSNWILSKIVDPGLRIDERADRIALMLKALAVGRRRMSRMDVYENSEGTSRKHVPSFIGNAVAAALVRPESRHYVFAWQLAVKNFTGTITHIESLEQVIPQVNDYSGSERPLTICVGWMLERLLEIICHVPNMVIDNNRLINFDKRRYVYNFVNNFTKDIADTQPERIEDPSAMILWDTFENKDIKDAAHRENQLSKFGKTKLFSRLLQQEQEKLRRDSKQREHLERQQKQQQRAETKRQPTPPVPSVESKKSAKRLGVNSIFKAVRPISMALTGSWTPPQSSGRMIPPSELPPLKSVEHGKKPVGVIDLRTVASVSCPRGTRTKSLWRINTDNRLSYLLQAPTEKDLEDWLKHIAAIRGVPTSDGGESVDALTVASNARVSQQVFGVPLTELCRRDRRDVPIVVEMLLSEIEKRGIAEVGIYRVPGSLASTNALRAALDAGEDVQMDDDRWYDVNAIAGAFKQFMRDLPDRPPGPSFLEELKKVTVDIPEEQDRIPIYRDIMARLPPHEYHFMRRVYFHFWKISENANVNKMHAVNLAIVFGMGLLPKGMIGAMSPDLGVYQTMVKTWIKFAPAVFQEVGVSQKDDVESPVTPRGDSVRQMGAAFPGESPLGIANGPGLSKSPISTRSMA